MPEWAACGNDISGTSFIKNGSKMIKYLFTLLSGFRVVTGGW